MPELVLRSREGGERERENERERERVRERNEVVVILVYVYKAGLKYSELLLIVYMIRHPIT